MRNKNQVFIHRSPIYLILFVLFAAVLLYLSTRLFFYDEDIFIVDPHSNFMSDLSRAAIVKLTFLIDHILYKSNTTGYHITNVLLHLANAGLAACVFKILLSSLNPTQLNTGNTLYFFLFLFLLSPIHSEPLCYLLGRAGLLVTLFCLLSLFFFLRAGFNNRILLIISLIFFLMALFTYEISWTLPFIILAMAAHLKFQIKPGRQLLVSYVAPYFIVFGLWFLINIIFINKLRITPYGNNVFLQLDMVMLLKNFAVIFFRNILPPFKNTAIFAVLSVLAGLLFCYFLLGLRNKKRPLFFLSLLLLYSWIFAFLPALVFGVNSHNSESERYIYFSSVFAIMFLAINFSLLPNQKIMLFTLALAGCIYACFLFSAIDDYIAGGRFSKDYLNVLAKEVNSPGDVYLVNQPSQCNGALIFRAYGDSKVSSEKHYYTINDYMHSLYPGEASQINYITLSKKAITKNDVITKVVVVAFDQLPAVFPEFKFDRSNTFLINSITGDSTFFIKSNTMIGLKLPVVYIFK